MDDLIKLLTWALEAIGLLDTVLLTLAVYLGRLHYVETKEHKMTRAHVESIQRKFVEAQVITVEVLSEVNLVLQQLMKRKDS